jgi:hypothetical protein
MRRRRRMCSGPGGRGTTHCGRDGANEIEGMAEGFPAIRLAWMEEDSSTGRMRLSWQAQQEDGSWRQETATVEPGGRHRLLELCREGAADFARREKGTPLDS